MALELQLQLKLSQQLAMTPQLQQAIKLLQLSRIELVETVQKELLENPFLEEAVAEVTLVEGDIEHSDDAKDALVICERVEQKTSSGWDDLYYNANWEDYLDNFSSVSRQIQLHEKETIYSAMPFDSRFPNKQSLEGHLGWQLRLSHFTPKEIFIGEAILGNLGSTGYLQATTEEVAKLAGVTSAEVESVLVRIQRFDPVGVAARSPQEALLVQLEARGEKDSILLSLVRNHLVDLGERRYKSLCRKFHINLDDLKHYIKILQELDPIPGASFGSEDSFYVTPDVFVYKLGNDWIVSLNEDGLPRLKLNSFYLDVLKLDKRREDAVKSSTCKEKSYMRDKMRSAMWFMKSLYQRQRTLYKVSESLVKHQLDFFEHGIMRLRPLNLKDIADDIGMHESTVSRVTTNKYVATPYGVFKLKFFFNSALELNVGGTVGSESVKALIKQLIDHEDPRYPLSDERIVEALKKKLRVSIARRTIAKYRTALDIPSSSKRKDVL